MVHIVPPSGWRDDIAASEPACPGASQEAALALSTTASVFIPAAVAADLSNTPTGLELQTLESPALAHPVAAATSPLLMWAVGGAAGCLLGGLAIALWPGRGDKVDSSPPPAASHDGAVAEQPKPAPTATAPSTDHAKPAVLDSYAVDHSKETATASTQTTAHRPLTEPAAVNSTPNDVAANTPPAPPDARAAAQSAPANATPGSPPVVKPAEKERDHVPVLKFDPLTFDPERLSLSAKTAANSNTTTSSVPDVAPSEVVSVPGVASEKNGSAPNDKLPQPAPKHSVTVHRGQPATENSPPHNANEQLANKVKSLQVTDMPLARWIDTLSSIAGTGITLDPIALELVGLSPQTTVTVDAQDATVEKILRDALQKKRLDILAPGDQVRVVLPKPDERRAADYDVKDLVPGTDAAAMARLIERFVAPHTWRAGGGAGNIQVNGTTLHIEQSDAIQRQVVIFCERLRLARGLPLRSKYPAALLSAESPDQRLSAKLETHTTFTFLAGTRLVDMFHQWQEMSGLTILVDWSALAEAELSPSSPVACSAIDRPWKDSFDGALEPLGLGWWAIDGQTIQITSLAAREKIRRIEFYTVPPKLRGSFANGQAVIDALQKEIAEAAGKYNKPNQIEMELDEGSGRLIVLASPGAHRYLSQRFGAGLQ